MRPEHTPERHCFKFNQEMILITNLSCPHSWGSREFLLWRHLFLSSIITTSGAPATLIFTLRPGRIHWHQQFYEVEKKLLVLFEIAKVTVSFRSIFKHVFVFVLNLLTFCQMVSVGACMTLNVLKRLIFGKSWKCKIWKKNYLTESAHVGLQVFATFTLLL